MVDTNQIGTFGELKSILAFISAGYSIYTPLSGKESYDFIACLEDKLIKVQVKTVSTINKQGSYEATIRSIRPNRTKNRVVKFDSSKCDVLSVYIQPLDKVCFLLSSEVISKSSITFREIRTNCKTHLISDYIDINRAISLC